MQPRPLITTDAPVWDYECTSAAPRVSLLLCVWGGDDVWPIMLGLVRRLYLDPSGHSAHLESTRLPTNSHTLCIQMHTQSKYSLKQAELLILLLSLLQHFHSQHSPPRPSSSFFSSSPSHSSFTFSLSLSLQQQKKGAASALKALNPLLLPLHSSPSLFHPSSLSPCQNPFIAVCGQWVAMYM